MKKVILSLDGGGARGVITLAYLQRLQYLLRKKTNPDAHVIDFVDVVAGTSSGAIIGALLAQSPKLSVERISDIFKRNLSRIFSTSIWRRIWTLDGFLWNRYKSAPLEECFDEFFGEAPLSSIQKSLIIPTYDTHKAAPYIFSSEKARRCMSDDFRLKDALRSAVAAPSYFAGKWIQPLSGEGQSCLIDGGVFANNPSMIAIGQMLSEDPGLSMRDISVISVGTGLAKYSSAFDGSSHWGSLMWGLSIIGLLIEATSSATERVCRKLTTGDAIYSRFNPPLFEKGLPKDLDNTSDKFIDSLLELACFELGRHQQELELVVDRLIKR